MLNLYDSFRRIIKVDTVCVDNIAFKLHYKLSVSILGCFALLLTSKQFFGDPIDCIQSDIPRDILDRYCFLHSPFTLVKAYDKVVGKDVPFPGIAKYVEGDEKVYHNYYAWVYFLLAFQTLMFYIPRYFWKIFESDHLKSLVMSLNEPILEISTKAKQLSLLLSYLKSNCRRHYVYFIKYVFCECLNLINVIILLSITNWQLNGKFLSYGIDVMNYVESENITNPRIKLFPRMVKCTFHQYGYSSDIQKHDALCLLAFNALNEKVFLFLWFWLFGMLFVSILNILYRIGTIFSLRLRHLILCKNTLLSDRNVLKNLVSKTNIGNWFLLSMLAKNIDPQNFVMIAEEY